jgi:hypothetical protein
MIAPPFNGLLFGKFLHANIPSLHLVQLNASSVGTQLLLTHLKAG